MYVFINVLQFLSALNHYFKGERDAYDQIILLEATLPSLSFYFMCNRFT